MVGVIRTRARLPRAALGLGVAADSNGNRRAAIRGAMQKTPGAPLWRSGSREPDAMHLQRGQFAAGDQR